IGHHQPPRQRALGPEQRENAPIETKNIHAHRKLSQPKGVRVVPKRGFHHTKPGFPAKKDVDLDQIIWPDWRY
ncbi:MAG: hypothetical protein WA770_11005, partial [Pseudolabrys sp.]